MSPFDPIALDRDAEVPLGTQLAWVLRARVTTGQLPAGERLPGARELAAHVGVNVNTVRAVFARLEEEGLLQVVHGKGTFVADGPPPETAVAELAAAVTSEARRRGIDPRAIAAALYVEPADDGAAGDAASRRALREQIAALEAQLAALPALPPTGDAAAVPPPRPSGAGRLLTTVELEQQRTVLAEQVAEARAQARAGGAGGATDVAASTAKGSRGAAAARGGRAAQDSPARDSATPLGGGRRGRVTLRWVPGA
ncbi:GntR family transcriptional regulator [Conexibacter woesei]|uniref:Transcriptional regulator, GntR family n=1 Tax=Conexibacter woesei (strain DSM 14684 / CCUG 47730 / CIP 108061 / JCM 11494 / NBRC 100937 / ID131577) TaxID=469383 RepID=D3F9H3_CONWI|nr:GntR family transcriptional regulator [Conexibacter woesei]ADB49140.1 transcriptional regulator, GntR family [Conexibacter woesei DSM 14684]